MSFAAFAAITSVLVSLVGIVTAANALLRRQVRIAVTPLIDDLRDTVQVKITALQKDVGLAREAAYTAREAALDAREILKELPVWKV